jgi:aspartate kinase
VIVMKFGGTSVGTSERILGLAEIVRERLPLRPVLVVSALSGVTDQLIRGARLALERDLGAEAVVQELKTRHRAVVGDLVPAGEQRLALFANINAVLSELQAFYVGVHNLGELTPRTLDAISAMGERMSFEIVAAALNERGVPARALDARQVIVTDDEFSRALPRMEPTTVRAREEILPLCQARLVPVLPGYIAANTHGVTTTLGRGGSD